MDTHTTTSSDRGADARLMFTVWTLLVGIGAVLHEALGTAWPLFSTSLLVMLLALAIVLRPGVVPLFVLFSAWHAIDAFTHMPYIVNHVMAHAIISLTVVAAYISLIREGRANDGAAFYARALPPIRVMVLIMYFFAGLAKANVHFLVPELSSAVYLLEKVHERVALVPTAEWTHMPVIWGTIVLEIALAVFLAIPRTRVPTVFVALAFHLAMAISGHPAFSALAPAFLFPFLPDDLPERLRAVRRRRPRLTALFERVRGVLTWPKLLPLLCVAWVTLTILIELGWVTREHRLSLLYSRVGLRQVILPYYALLAAALWMCVVEGPVRYREAFLRVRPVLLALPAVMLLNALCPYLGLKTESSFTMFSNLQTEGDQWNHLFLPSGMRLFGYQADLVYVVESDDEFLRGFADEEEALVHFELHRYLAEHPEVSVSFRRGGELNVVARAGDHEVYSEPPPFLVRKALWFRPVERPGNNGHRH